MCMCTHVCMQVLYRGKSQCLGMKSTPASPAVNHSSSAPAAAASSAGSEWRELVIVKCPRVIECSVGHEGQHGLLVTDDGSVFFVGVARRGEDGDTASASLRELSITAAPSCPVFVSRS